MVQPEVAGPRRKGLQCALGNARSRSALCTLAPQETASHSTPNILLSVESARQDFFVQGGALLNISSIVAHPRTDSLSITMHFLSCLTSVAALLVCSQSCATCFCPATVQSGGAVRAPLFPHQHFDTTCIQS